MNYFQSISVYFDDTNLVNKLYEAHSALNSFCLSGGNSQGAHLFLWGTFFSMFLKDFLQNTFILQYAES